DIEELELRVNNIVARTRLLHEKFAASPLTPATGLQSVDQRFMEKLLKCCEAHYSNPGFDADLFTDELNVSLSTLHRKIKTICGTTPLYFLKNYRLQKAYDMIAAKNGSVSEIAFLCGFENLSYFARIFKEKFDSLPSEVIYK
ncbi:MAG TPA: helix-turn-helix transcriptional regulator, partial [Bacteroidales bacterium]|nr:helix-turn-helix transcriptional regulator [Bacteroidales bacterium]